MPFVDWMTEALIRMRRAFDGDTEMTQEHARSLGPIWWETFYVHDVPPSEAAALAARKKIRMVA